MQITTRHSSYSSYDDGIQLVVDADGTKVHVDLMNRELEAFALNLLDVADDCLRKLNGDKYDEAIQHLSEAVNCIHRQE